MQQSEFIDTCNAWAEAGTPFLFIIDYELEQFRIFRPEEAAAQGVFYNIRGRSNVPGLRGEVSQHFGATALPEDQPAEPSGSQLDSLQEDQSAAPLEEKPSATPGDQLDPLKEEQPAVPHELKDKVPPESRITFPPGMRTTAPPGFRFEAVPMAFPRYEKAFSLVKKHILHGNSFLLNLTFPTLVRTDLTLQQIFHAGVAPYRLLFGDRFVVFSPETFVKIGGNVIRSFPMKGTIDASLPGAERLLMENEKELWEHNTIVDLIRNDLSMVSAGVRVTRFRYIDRIRTHRGELLQVSSEIEGRLGDGWRSRLGELLLRMLPAGSICGAPKRKTREIIAEAEGEKRGFFTGIFGLFDGEAVDSAVMIRFIERVSGEQTNGGQTNGEQTNEEQSNGEQTNGEQTNGGQSCVGLQFRSGGGITGHSEAAAEYKEMIDKVYVPIVRV